MQIISLGVRSIILPVTFCAGCCQTHYKIKKKILYLQVAGGIICGENIQESMIRECAEEASISEELARTATPAGCVRYRYCTETIPWSNYTFSPPQSLSRCWGSGGGGGAGRIGHCLMSSHIVFFIIFLVTAKTSQNLWKNFFLVGGGG